MMLVLIWAGVACLAVYAIASAYGGWRWSGKTRDLVAQMQAGRVMPTTTH